VPLLLLLAACSPHLPDPVVIGADPDWAYNGERTDVIVEGENFFPSLELASGSGSDHLDRQFEVRLLGVTGTYDLDGVELASYRSLEAVVPEGLPTGLYDLRVIAPSGAWATLADAFTVTDSRADHLAFDLEDVVFDVNTPFIVAFDLRDPEERTVFQAMQVVLTVTAPSGLHELVIDTSGFDDALRATVEGGVTVLGFLDDGGRGWVSLTATIPEILSLEIEAVESDTTVRGDAMDIAVAAGELTGVEISLPYTGFMATAGDPFPINLRLVDVWGNLLEEAYGHLTLTEACGGLFQEETFYGSMVVEVAVQSATCDDCECEENTILAMGTTSGVSAGFPVEPNDPAAYGVSVYPRTVEAGTAPVYTMVIAQDAWGNQVRDYNSDIELLLYDTLGGLDPDSDRGVQECPGFSAGIQFCRAWPWIAGAADRIRAVGSDRLEGLSPVFDVMPGPLAEVRISLGPGPFTAGEPFDLDVQPLDAFGNGLDTDPTIDDYRFTGGVGPVTCTWDGVIRSDDTRRFACTATLATTAQTITVSVEDLDPTITTTTTPFVIQNGSLVAIAFDLAAGTEVEAGSTFSVGLAGTDAWDNPYVVQSDPDVLLADDTGSLLPVVVTLDAEGCALVEASITTAAEDIAISAFQAGTALGTSASFDVVSASPAVLELALDRPWAFVDQACPVTVRAVDAWGNVVPTFDDPVSVTSASALADAILLDTWDDGTTAGEVTFEAHGVADTLLAVASPSGLTGSASVDVLELGCGVTADLLVEGSAEAVLCLAAGVASGTLDASASLGSPVLFGFWDDTGNSARGSDATTTFHWHEPGAVALEAVAFTADACGDASRAVAYVALDDGEPAGPVSVEPAFTTRSVGSSTDGVTTIDLAAHDCAGDRASGARLLVRTDLGEFIAGTITSGTGLVATLDAAGETTVTWSVASGTYGGTATVLAGNASGSAIGTATIDVQGDDARPFVVDLDPRGSCEGITSTVTVRFSEAMRAASFTLPSNRITISDSGGPLALSGISVSTDATEATATLETAIDLAADTYDVTVSSEVRDTAGNRLDGRWTGTTAAFQTTIGAVEDTAPDVLACTADTAVFRPDGDGAPGTEEADEVVVEVVADALPSWWHLEVTDAEDHAILTNWIEAASIEDQVSWTGVDLDGIVVSNGAYVLRITASDEVLDLGEACEVGVEIDNHLVEPD
jgi:hypothetical protein